MAHPAPLQPRPVAEFQACAPQPHWWGASADRSGTGVAREGTVVDRFDLYTADRRQRVSGVGTATLHTVRGNGRSVLLGSLLLLRARLPFGSCTYKPRRRARRPPSSSHSHSPRSAGRTVIPGLVPPLSHLDERPRQATATGSPHGSHGRVRGGPAEGRRARLRERSRNPIFPLLTASAPSGVGGGNPLRPFFWPRPDFHTDNPAGGAMAGGPGPGPRSLPRLPWTDTGLLHKRVAALQANTHTGRDWQGTDPRPGLCWPWPTHGAASALPPPAWPTYNNMRARGAHAPRSHAACCLLLPPAGGPCPLPHSRRTGKRMPHIWGSLWSRSVPCSAGHRARLGRRARPGGASPAACAGGPRPGRPGGRGGRRGRHNGVPAPRPSPWPGPRQAIAGGYRRTRAPLRKKPNEREAVALDNAISRGRLASGGPPFHARAHDGEQ